MTYDFDFAGLENALIDVTINAKQELIDELKLVKGAFNQLSSDKVSAILENNLDNKRSVQPAGACFNTISALSKLGAKTCFIGRIGRDDFGKVYKNKLNELRIKSLVQESETKKTGLVLCFVTPDGERTFAVNLGAALELEKNDFSKGFPKSKVVYVTGYVLEEKNLRDVSLKLLEHAKENNSLIAIDLGDAQLVKRNKDVLRKIITDYADILFANEIEAENFTGIKNYEESINELSKLASTVVIKLGEKGSIVKQNGKLVRIPSKKLKVVDLTGAGDAYAAGFLWAHLHGKDLAECGKLGTYLAGKVIAKYGASL